MSTTASAAAVEGKTPDTKPSLPGEQRRTLDYLRSSAGAKTYLKSHLIADNLDLSMEKVGANMCPILDDDLDVIVEKWGYSSGTTWKMTV